MATSSASRPRFVGRDRELAELRAGLDDALGGRGRLFLISGEPGIGKTCLAEEISREARERGVRVLWGRCWEGGGAPAYWPIIQIVRGCAERSDFAQAVETLGGGIGQVALLVPEIIRQAPSHDQRPGLERVCPEQARFRLFDAVGALLRNLASREPMVIAIDDLHEADAGALQMLRFLARTLKDAPILLVGTHREAEVERSPELRSAMADLAHEGAQLSLSGLNLADAAQLVLERAGITPGEEFLATLHRTTEGNPLFLHGVLHVLASEGKLKHLERLVARDLKLPRDVRRAIRSRFEGLSKSTTIVLSAASGIGIEFDLVLLGRVTCASEGESLEALDEAVALGVIAPAPDLPTAFRFTHALVRSVIYEEMGSAERAQLHKQIGEALEATHAGDVSAHLSEIANNYRLAIAAGTAEKAIEYSIRTGKAADSVHAYEEAISQFEAAVALMEQHGADPRRRAGLLVRLGTLLYWTDTRLGIEHMESALATYEELGLREEAASVEVLLGQTLAAPGQRVDTSRALIHLRNAEANMGEGPPSLELASRYFGLGMVASRKSQLREALAAHTNALKVGERLGSDDIWCVAAAGVAYFLVLIGRISKAQDLLVRVWPKLPAVKDPSLAFFFYTAWLGGGCHLILNDARRARPWFLSGLDNPQLSKYQQDVMHVNMADTCLQLGDIATAKQHLAHRQQLLQDESIRNVAGALCAAIDDDWQRAAILWQAELDYKESKFAGPEVQHFYQRALAYALRESGEIQKAEEILFSALAPCSDDEPRLNLEMVIRPELALTLATAGKLELAEAQIRRCSEILAGGEDWRGLTGFYHRATAVCAAAAGNTGESEHHFTAAIETFRRTGPMLDEAYTFRCWGHALAIANEPLGAEKFDAAIEIYRRMGHPQTLRRTLEEKQHALAGSVAGKASRPESDCVFQQEGEYWTVAYEGQSARLRERGGMRLIALLLGRPSENIPVLDMFANGTAPGPAIAPHKELNGRADLGDAGEEIDARALSAYRHRIAELDSEIERAEAERQPDAAASAHAERDMLLQEIASGTGLHGRLRHAASHRERVRVNVTKQIKSAIAAIRQANPSLGRHLANSIYTGIFCRYAPSEPVAWKL